MIKRWVAVALAATFVFAACGSGSDSSVSAFCTQVKAFRAKYQDTSTSPTASEIAKASVELQAIAKSAPEAIRDDTQTVSEAFDIYAAGKTPPAYRAKEIQTASDNLTKYGEKHCGIQVPTPST
jgi:hypothetical protein